MLNKTEIDKNLTEMLRQLDKILTGCYHVEQSYKSVTTDIS